MAPWLAGSAATAPPAPEVITASADRVETVLTKTNQRQYEPVCPEGSIRVSASMQVSGWARLSHTEFLIPPDLEPPKGFNLKLPSGWTLHPGASLAYGGGLGGFDTGNMFGIAGRAPDNKPLDVFSGSLCTGAAACTGPGWGSAELDFERYLSPDCSMRFFFRIKRVAGDPLLYVSLTMDPGIGMIDSVRFSGYPGWHYPITYNIRDVWIPAPYLPFERHAWVAGQDWNLHDAKEKHNTPVDENSPGGVYFYNRGSVTTAGMLVVFLPEEIASASAAGTYGTETRLVPRRGVVHFALLNWKDPRGWEVALPEFAAKLPATMEKLRSMTFAWPLRDPLGAASRAQAKLLVDAVGLPEEPRQALAEALAAYETALAAVTAAPVEETEERYALERNAILAAQVVERAILPLEEQWVQTGGTFETEAP